MHAIAAPGSPEPSEEQVLQEIRSRAAETDTSAPARIRGWRYDQQTEEGKGRRHRRRPVEDDEPPVDAPPDTLPQVRADANLRAWGRVHPEVAP